MDIPGPPGTRSDPTRGRLQHLARTPTPTYLGSMATQRATDVNRRAYAAIGLIMFFCLSSVSVWSENGEESSSARVLTNEELTALLIQFSDLNNDAISLLEQQQKIDQDQSEISENILQLINDMNGMFRRVVEIDQSQNAALENLVSVVSAHNTSLALGWLWRFVALFIGIGSKILWDKFDYWEKFKSLFGKRK